MELKWNIYLEHPTNLNKVLLQMWYQIWSDVRRKCDQTWATLSLVAVTAVCYHDRESWCNELPQATLHWQCVPYRTAASGTARLPAPNPEEKFRSYQRLQYASFYSGLKDIKLLGLDDIPQESWHPGQVQLFWDNQGHPGLSQDVFSGKVGISQDNSCISFFRIGLLSLWNGQVVWKTDILEHFGISWDIFSKSFTRFTQ